MAANMLAIPWLLSFNEVVMGTRGLRKGFTIVS
jgi:hypothetical protein